MRLSRVGVLLILVVLLAAIACSPDRQTPPKSSPRATTGNRTAPPGGALVSFGDQVVVAEVADEPDEQRTGLMHRESLEDGAGMLFLFDERRDGGFWMKNTLIPLSIAYMASTGQGSYEVVAILDMEPCEDGDLCPTYPPGRDYDAALEVDQGWFEEAGVAVGDRAAVSL